MTSEALRSGSRNFREPRRFLEFLAIGGSQWDDARRGDLAFRGQADSSWHLEPKSHRKGERVGFGAQAPRANLLSVKRQSRAEFEAIATFVRTADAAGIPLTSSFSRLIGHTSAEAVFNDPHWHYTWPIREAWEWGALAQHHGVPTRLLDFSEDPLVAAFFAASFALQDNHSSPHPKYIAVWVVDLRFLDALSERRFQFPEPVQVVRMAKGSNTFLRAQSGLFLIDQSTNDMIQTGTYEPMDRTILRRAKHWHTGRRLSASGMKRTWFSEQPLFKACLPTSRCSDLLFELERLGVTHSTMMPALDSIAHSARLSSQLPIR